MATLLRCDNCDKQIKLDEDFGGKSIRCPRCKEVVRVRGRRQQEDDDDDRREQRSGRRRKQQSGSMALWIGLGVGGAALVLIAVVIGVVVVIVAKRPPVRPDNVALAPVDARGGPAAVAELSPARAIKPGVLFQEAVLRPGAVPMKVWYYRPEQAKGKLPLVLVPPAGSTLFAGMDLGDGDRDEHYPYVRAGFTVGSFEIDGFVPDGQGDAVILQGAREFRDARAGLNNAKAALDFLLAKAPDVDQNRIFIAGHSSAATLSLLVAAHEPRIKGCIAYCGVPDVETHLAPVIPQLDRGIPGYRDFIRFSSPKTHVEKLKCPVFLFHAQDDTTVPVSQTTTFAELLKKTNRDVTVDTSARGGHHQPMIDAGIPRGIAWMQKR
ncbi:MAG: prolyl oligopeptidase family serine peptidase [Planctomycetes bacterium]|nr:prolyl oligopeptidase family serine peptidase [Planctomycetota bacterium]